MRTLKRFFGRERGAAIVEFALVVPLFVMLVWGLIMFSRAYTRLNALNSSLREGARTAAALQFPDSASYQAIIKGRVYQFSTAFGFPIDTSQVTITYVPGGPDVTLSVTNYQLFAGLNFLGGLQNLTVSRSVVFRHEWASG
jgi:Flp pilus assembly protein TadG